MEPNLPPQTVSKTCPSCKAAIVDSFFFCPQCGKKLRPVPVSTTVGKQIGIYLLSFFLPPLGLIPGIQYLFDKSGKAKAIGIVAIVLTVISTAITGYYFMQFLNQYNQILNSYGSLGY